MLFRSVITGGLPAAALTMLAVCIALYAALHGLLGRTQNFRSDPYNQLGLIIIVLIGIVSFSDYPLRTPLLQVYFVVAVVWVSCPTTLNRPMAGADTHFFPDRIGNQQGR